ncbi:MAG: hypothetical protein J7M34_01695 [Anaerolineae bacterium]|nr:hypothetical protein [Anaerolineae bacterium]
MRTQALRGALGRLWEKKPGSSEGSGFSSVSITGLSVGVLIRRLAQATAFIAFGC